MLYLAQGVLWELGPRRRAARRFPSARLNAVQVPESSTLYPESHYFKLNAIEGLATSGVTVYESHLEHMSVILGMSVILIQHIIYHTFSM